MKDKKYIVSQLKHDIYTLWNIARSNTSGGDAVAADEAYDMIISGLADYEQFWRIVMEENNGN